VAEPREGEWYVAPTEDGSAVVLARIVEGPSGVGEPTTGQRFTPQEADDIGKALRAAAEQAHASRYARERGWVGEDEVRLPKGEGT
jgi:hypothetical protein